MNTVALRVEAAMRATSARYAVYESMKDSKIPLWKRESISQRTLAAVKHDRYLNGRK